MELTQREIEQLSLEEFTCFLAYGNPYICESTTNDEYEEYLKSYLMFDL